MLNDDDSRRRLIQRGAFVGLVALVLAVVVGGVALVVEGIATNFGDVPVEGVRIRMWPADDWWAAQPFGDPPVTLLEATSDEHGHFRIDAAPRLASLVTEIAGGEGLMTRYFAAETGPETDRPLLLDQLVTSAYEATGTITSVHGEPVSGAFVFAIAEELRGRWDTSTLVSLTETEREEVVSVYQTLRAAQEERRLKWVGYRATTNEDGTFTMSGLASVWSYRLFAIHPEHGRSEPSPPTAAAALAPYRASLRGLANVVVHVESGGEPVDDAEILQPWSRDTTVWPTSTTGAYGPVRAEVGPHVTEARHPEHPSAAYAGPLLLGIENHVQLTLPAGHVVTGRVIDLRDHYVEGATVTLGERTATTDIAGKFELRGVGAGERTLRAEKDGLEARHMKVAVPGPAVEIRLRPLSVVTLQLVLPRGDPEPTWVEAQAVTQRQDKWSRDPPNLEPVVSLDWNDGHVELRTVPGERGLVSVLVPGYQIVVRDVHPRGAETVELGRVQLVPARSVHGVVRGEGIGAIEGARVVLRPWSDLLRHGLLRDHVVLADAEGAFRVDVPWAEGEEVYAKLTAIADGFAPDAHTIGVDAMDIDATPVDFALVRGVVLRGTVVHADGAPVAAAFIGASATDLTYTDSAGRFALRVRELPVTLRSAYDEGDLGVLRSSKIWFRRYVSRLFGTADQAGLLQGSVEVTRKPERGEELRIVLGLTQ